MAAAVWRAAQLGTPWVEHRIKDVVAHSQQPVTTRDNIINGVVHALMGYLFGCPKMFN